MNNITTTFMIDELEKKFYIYAEEVKKLPIKPSNDELLNLYALYKQITVGNNNYKKPSIINIKKTAKWKRWKSLSNKNKDRIWCIKKYIKLVKELYSKYN